MFDFLEKAFVENQQDSFPINLDDSFLIILRKRETLFITKKLQHTIFFVKGLLIIFLSALIIYLTVFLHSNPIIL